MWILWRIDVGPKDVHGGAVGFAIVVSLEKVAPLHNGHVIIIIIT